MARKFGDGKFYDWDVAKNIIDQARAEGWGAQKTLSLLPKDGEGNLPTITALERQLTKGRMPRNTITLPSLVRP